MRGAHQRVVEFDLIVGTDIVTWISGIQINTREWEHTDEHQQFLCMSVRVNIE